MRSSSTESESARARAETIFAPTGEPLGTEPWRRWRTEDGWHPLTPQAIRDEYDWLFERTEYSGRVTSEQIARAIRENYTRWSEAEREWFRAAYAFLKAREEAESAA